MNLSRKAQDSENLFYPFIFTSSDSDLPLSYFLPHPFSFLIISYALKFVYPRASRNTCPFGADALRAIRYTQKEPPPALYLEAASFLYAFKPLCCVSPYASIITSRPLRSGCTWTVRFRRRLRIRSLSSSRSFHILS